MMLSVTSTRDVTTLYRLLLTQCSIQIAQRNTFRLCTTSYWRWPNDLGPSTRNFGSRNTNLRQFTRKSSTRPIGAPMTRHLRLCLTPKGKQIATTYGKIFHNANIDILQTKLYRPLLVCYKKNFKFQRKIPKKIGCTSSKDYLIRAINRKD